MDYATKPNSKRAAYFLVYKAISRRMFFIPWRSLIISDPLDRSLFSDSRADCKLRKSFSNLSLAFSSAQFLSCRSLLVASSCWICFVLSVWFFLNLAAVSDSVRSRALASSSYWTMKNISDKWISTKLLKTFPRWRQSCKLLLIEQFEYTDLKWSLTEQVKLKQEKSLTCLCSWLIFSFDIWEFWFRLFKSSSWSFKLFTGIKTCWIFKVHHAYSTMAY